MWPFSKQAQQSIPSEDGSIAIRNDDLVELLARLQDDPRVYVEIYETLLARNFVVGAREPIDTRGQWLVLDDDLDVTLLGTTGPGGGSALPIFTDAEALFARNPQAHAIGMPAAQLVRMALEDEEEGIVINPAGDWMFIPREQLETLVAGAES